MPFIKRRALLALALSAGLSACATEYERLSDELSIPDWASAGPAASDFIAAYPQRAFDSQTAGRAVLACLIQTDRALQCTVREETPPGMGFGAAALAVAARYRVKTFDGDPRYAAGAPIVTAVRFVPPE
jgi:hypothetical protein